MELARQGAHAVVIVDRDLAGANDTAEAVRAAGAEAAVYQADVSDEVAMNDLAAQVRNKHGVVDILINNAGIGMAGRFLETTPEHWDTIIGVNVRGVINGSRAFGAQMVERGQGARSSMWPRRRRMCRQNRWSPTAPRRRRCSR
ncbi:short chain dehydrogenase family protein [Mycobacterium kansasii]|uniref:Short chain dehydrogenase family protein n=1 Tax=Mycobacterium kansasii TaxID=1768 RepID=A0A1V3XY40_MYCKA|nr:short chain dehydrogenase family protein [Mycobacterium kansasii]